MSIVQSVHPFPARMAAEIALDVLKYLPVGSHVLDPMAGSGTVLRAATTHGHTALGLDIDPLAILMARVWTTPLAPDALVAAAAHLVEEAQALPDKAIVLPWVDDDLETRAFIDFWFGGTQQLLLRRLSYALKQRDEGDAIADALRVALSRIIVTKGRGASLAIDVVAQPSAPRLCRARFRRGVRVPEIRQAGFRETCGATALRLHQDMPR